jgi:dipeptidyl aminopeptidase/acylaminoacyl peptidase
MQFAGTGGETAHALYYAPINPSYEAPAGSLPPLVVMAHGGPTARVTVSYNPMVQFFTTRGIAVVDVNYGGSSGYGRRYRERLAGQWGVVDVGDCAAAARHLVEEGSVDPDRLAIRGGSGGGYTTLLALTTTNVFRVGCSFWGIADLEVLVRHMHKFEAHYFDRLVGPWPEAKALYRERSPIDHVDNLNCPVILIQGSDDPIVPPEQAELMLGALRRKRIPHAYLLFDGESHGLRRAENWSRALEAELLFYGAVLDFDPADRIDPIEVHT